MVQLLLTIQESKRAQNTNLKIRMIYLDLKFKKIKGCLSFSNKKKRVYYNFCKILCKISWFWDSRYQLDYKLAQNTDLKFREKEENCYISWNHFECNNFAKIRWNIFFIPAKILSRSNVFDDYFYVSEVETQI